MSDESLRRDHARMLEVEEAVAARLGVEKADKVRRFAALVGMALSLEHTLKGGRADIAEALADALVVGMLTAAPALLGGDGLKCLEGMVRAIYDDFEAKVARRPC